MEENRREIVPVPVLRHKTR